MSTVAQDRIHRTSLVRDESEHDRRHVATAEAGRRSLVCVAWALWLADMASSAQAVATKSGTTTSARRNGIAGLAQAAASIGDGLDLAEVREQLLAAKTTVATLETQLSALAPAPVDLERIKRRVDDRRSILRRGPAMARSRRAWARAHLRPAHRRPNRVARPSTRRPSAPHTPGRISGRRAEASAAIGTV